VWKGALIGGGLSGGRPADGVISGNSPAEYPGQYLPDACCGCDRHSINTLSIIVTVSVTHISSTTLNYPTNKYLVDMQFAKLETLGI